MEGAGDHLADIDLGSLKSESHAIVYGRILNSRSFFEESPFEIESGENIITEYEFQIARVLKDTTTEVIPPAPKPAPALLTSPLRIARNGGVVVNDDRSLRSLSSSNSLQAHFNRLNLETFLSELEIKRD